MPELNHSEPAKQLIKYDYSNDAILLTDDEWVCKNNYNGSNGVGLIRYNFTSKDAEAFEEVLLKAETQINFLPCYHSKLLFLYTTIFILLETGRRFVENPTLTEDLICLYWSTCNKAIKEDKVSPKYILDACEKYLRIIVNDASQDWFERKKAIKKGSREDECVEISITLNKLYRNAKSKSLEKTSIELNEEQERQCLQLMELAKEKLMSWYNLNAAVDVTIAQVNSRKFSVILRYYKLYFFEILAIIYLLFCLSLYIRPSFVIDQSILLVFIYLTAVWGLIRFCYLIKKDSKFYLDYQIHLPRLWAGIVVGFFVLINDEAWSGIFKVDDWIFALLGRIGVPCLTVIFYIFVEISNVEGINVSQRVNKILKIFSRGSAYAVLTGIVISDLFGENMVGRIDPTVDPAFYGGLFGNIYPEVVFYLGPLALFIGVFVQLLWDDKTLTAKFKSK